MQTNSVRRLVRALMSTALAAAGLTAVAAAPAGAATLCQQTFTNSAVTAISGFSFSPPLPPLFIPMPVMGTGSSAVTASEGTVADVDVTVHVTNTSADQLTLSLQHGATTVTLKAGGAQVGTELASTTFDDEASQDIASGTPPYSGAFRPTQPLSAYDAAAAGGSWTLAVSNPSPSSGTIDSWSVAITYSGTCDNDSDGVEDHADQCPGLAGHTASGCPLASSAATANFRHGKFKGTLSSTVPACRAGQSVSIWKARKGPDRLVGSRTTAADGTWKLKRAKRAGRYYATSLRVVLGNVAECPAVQSPTFRLR